MLLRLTAPVLGALRLIRLTVVFFSAGMVLPGLIVMITEIAL